MTPEKKAKQQAKRAIRMEQNEWRKVLKAEARHNELVALGKTLITTEKDGVVNYSLPDIQEPPPFNMPPAHAFVGAKMYVQHGQSRKNHSGHAPEHAAAILENERAKAESL